MELTVAICTFQRLEPLRLTLASLAECDPSDHPWELLVVDNGNQPTVRELVGEFEQRFDVPVRYVAEPTLGTSHARNRAVREARAPVILFTDDDVTFARSWLSTMARAIREHDDCAFWGGRVEPVWSTEPPKWFDQDRCPLLGDTIVQYRCGNDPRYWVSEQDPPFYTANLALRRDQIERVGYFDTNVGHRGDRRMGMEDSLMVKAISKAGGRGWYAADAVVNHPVEAVRVTRRYARGFAWRQGWLSVDILRRENPREGHGGGGGSRGSVPRWLFRVAIGQAVGGLVRWGRGLVTLKPSEAFAGQIQALFNMSKLWHAVWSPRSSDDAVERSTPASTGAASDAPGRGLERGGCR